MQQQYKNKNLYVKLTYPAPGSPAEPPDPKLAPHYFSVAFLDTEYFSSILTNTSVTSSASATNDHFAFGFNSPAPTSQYLTVVKWCANVPLFTYIIELTELASKNNLRKRLRITAMEFLEVTISLVDQEELPFSDRKPGGDMAHYFSFDSLKFIPTNPQRSSPSDKDDDQGYCPYLSIITDFKQYVVPCPLKRKSIMLQLPDKIKFEYYTSYGTDPCRSDKIDTTDIFRKGNVNLSTAGEVVGSVEFEGRWGINKMSVKSETFLDSYEIAIYDFQMVFDRENQYPDCHLKISYGNKVFDCAPDANNGKRLRFKKLIHFYLKPEEEELGFCLEKNHVEFASFRLFTDELQPSQTLKRKMTDINNGKSMGTLKFRLEKARNLSLPENNPSWREVLRKKITSPYVYEVSQLSYHTPVELAMNSVRVCIGNNQAPVKGIYNLAYYLPSAQSMHQNQGVNSFQVRDEKDLFIFFDDNSAPDKVQAMGVVDLNSLGLGLNPLRIPLFRNQKIIGQIHALVNKIPNIYFAKPSYQTELLTKIKKRNRNISLSVSPIDLTSYFYTYQYDNKTDMYAIVEINKDKKVLILNRKENRGLRMVEGDGSDYLNFVIEEAENIRIKMTFLVADLGFEQEIYGTAVFKCKYADLASTASSSNNFVFPQTHIKNAFDLGVGSLVISARLGEQPSKANANANSPLMSEINKLRTSVEEANKNIRRSLEQNSTTHRYNNTNNNSLNTSIDKQSNKTERKPIKLPTLIKNTKAISVAAKDNSIKSLVAQYKGININPRLNRSNHPINLSNRKIQPILLEDTMEKINADVEKNKQYLMAQRAPIKKKPIRQQQAHQPFQQQPIKMQPSHDNVNVDRNFELLFPKKKMRKADLQLQINQYQQKLKGLKSVLNEIDGDLMNVEPDGYSQRSRRNKNNELAAQKQEAGAIDSMMDMDDNKKPVLGPDPSANVSNAVEFQDNQFM